MTKIEQSSTGRWNRSTEESAEEINAASEKLQALK